MKELKFKVGDIVIYANANNEKNIVPVHLKPFWMKPALIYEIEQNDDYPYRIQLLKDKTRKNIFVEKELIYFPNNEKELFGMLIRKEITEEEYEEFIKI